MNLVKPIILTLVALAIINHTTLRGEIVPQRKTVTMPAASDKSAKKKGGAPAVVKSPDKPEVKSTEKPAIDLTPTQKDKLLTLLNRGTAVELTAISGIAATRAEAIVGARPFQKVHEVMLVPGVGDATFKSILEHGKTLTQPAAKSSKS